MTVSMILAGKGREVVTIEPNATLGDAVQLLAEKRIGAIVTSRSRPSCCRDFVRTRHRPRPRRAWRGRAP